MDTKRKNEILAIANDNLQKLFPAKVIVPITHDDIEKVYKRNVLGIATDAKTKKGLGRGYLTGILYLAPEKLSGVNMCPSASKGCTAACLFSAGRGAFASITKQRIIKTLAYHFDSPRFVESIKKSIRSLITKAENSAMTPVVRLNGTSDILWERNTDILQSFPNITFYDYTKIAKRFLLSVPDNYHLTLSLSENNDTDARLALSKGHNVAAVWRKELPPNLWGYRVVNGDESDLRFLDPKGCVVGLKAKGKAKKDASGFVRDYGEVNRPNSN